MKCCRLTECVSVLIACLVSAGFIANKSVSPTNESRIQESNQQESSKSAVTSDQESDEAEFAPVDNMHHFMEYICEPSYKGLMQALANEPADRKAWKVFKNHALVLAETSALVAERGPDKEDDAKQWHTLALAVYKHGKDLYKSSGKYEDAKKNWGLMIDNCNKCHMVFANGKYQLAK